MRLRVLGVLAVLSVFAGAAKAQILYEDFESLADGELHGQGGWAADAGILLVSSGFLPTRSLSGTTLGGLSNIRYASHGVSLAGYSDILTLGFDAFGVAGEISDGPFSHNSGAGLGNAASLLVGWTAFFGAGWTFDASAITTDGFAETFAGGMNAPAKFEVIIDQVAGKVFGRYSYDGTNFSDTTHFTLNTSALSLLTHVTIQQDMTDQQARAGVDLDNILLTHTASPASVPEPFTVGLGLAGAGLAVRRKLKARKA